MRYFIKFFAISCLINAAASGILSAQTIDVNSHRLSLPALEKAAQKGDGEMQHLLCMIYHNGIQISKNPAKALHYCSAAAKQNRPMAQAILGTIYKEGLGVARNYSTALKWLHKGAKGKAVVAQVELSDMYSKGIGVKQDPVMAYMWVNVAASLDPHPDTFRLRDWAAARLSKAQLAQGQALATKCVQGNYQTCGK